MADNSKKYVVLISPTEKLTFMVEDTTFFYRRLPPGKRNELLTEHCVRGTFDYTSAIAYELAVATYCLRGWENLRNAEGHAVPFLEEIIAYLPITVIKRIADLAEDASPEEMMARFFASSTNAGPSSDQAANP